MTLYELTADFQKFADIVSADDTSEEMKDAMKDALENLCEDIDEKIDDYGKVIKNKKSNIEARKAEIERLQALNESDKKAIERMMKVVDDAMTITGRQKVKTSLFNFYKQKNPVSVVLEEGYIENIPEAYLIPQDPKVDKYKLKVALECDDEEVKRRLEGIAHLEQTESLRIR